MQRFKDILFYAASSADSDPALERAVELAQRNQARLTVVGVLRELPRELSRLAGGVHPADLLEMAALELRERLERLVAPCREKLPALDAKVLCGTPFIEIIRAVLGSGHDLVMMSADSAGLPRGLLFGSTSLHLMRKCPCPVWVLKPAAERRIARILAAVDPDSADAVRDAVAVKIMELATSLAHIEAAELHVVHVWENYDKALAHWWQATVSHLPAAKVPRQLQEAHRREFEHLLGGFARTGVDLRAHLLQGDIAGTIAQLARRRRIDVIVMGTAGRTGIAGFFMGNTAETVLRQVNCAVLTVKPDAFVTPVRLEESPATPESRAGRPVKTAAHVPLAPLHDTNPPSSRGNVSPSDHKMLANLESHTLSKTKKERQIIMKNNTSEAIQQLVAGDEPATVPARFEFESATAKSVGVAGTFNAWDPTVSEMQRDGVGRWVKELILPPGTYEYRFVVDGEWVDDPQASETIANPFGGSNAVLKVVAPVFA